jgi:5-hydroxyisourate hydrolase-like protein (transthyretin family)
MMEAIFTPETSVYFNETTTRYIREGSDLSTRRSKNSKYHEMYSFAEDYFTAVDNESASLNVITVKFGFKALTDHNHVCLT